MSGAVAAGIERTQRDRFATLERFVYEPVQRYAGFLVAFLLLLWRVDAEQPERHRCPVGGCDLDGVAIHDMDFPRVAGCDRSVKVGDGRRLRVFVVQVPEIPGILLVVVGDRELIGQHDRDLEPLPVLGPHVLRNEVFGESPRGNVFPLGRGTPPELVVEDPHVIVEVLH